MSAKDASDRREPVEDEVFAEELAAFLSEEWCPATEASDSGFDISDFLAGLYNVDGVLFIPAAVEVPLAAFLEAQKADALYELEIAVDKRGEKHYLVGVLAFGGDRVVLVSAFLEDDA